MAKFAGIAKAILFATADVLYTSGVIFSRKSLYQKQYLLESGYKRWQINKILDELIKRDYVQENKKGLKITKKGEKRVDYFKLKDLHFKPNNSLVDGNVRIIIFDIPEKIRHIRKLLRDKIKEWKCVRLQNSVFVTKYNCEKELKELIKILDIRPYIYVITVPEEKFPIFTRSDKIGR